MVMIKEGHLGGNITGGDPDTYEPRLWRWLVDKYSVRTVLDVGCGQGHSIAEFSRLGCCAIGLDGFRENADYLEVPVICHDLTTGPLYVSNIDLVWCCEVAEHIDPEFVDNFIDTIACGKVIAMTFCRKGVRGGHHHVNLQMDDYWISKVESRGFRYLGDKTAKARKIAQHCYFQSTGLIFRKP